jgi:hypothetical protein
MLQFRGRIQMAAGMFWCFECCRSLASIIPCFCNRGVTNTSRAQQEGLSVKAASSRHISPQQTRLTNLQLPTPKFLKTVTHSPFRSGIWGSSVVITTGYELDGHSSVRGRGNKCILLYSVHTSSGVHLTSCPMGTEGSFPGGEVAGEWSWKLASI